MSNQKTETETKDCNPFSLEGKVALVTGGAGDYGKQITAALARAGAKVFIASRNLDALSKLASEYRAEGLDVEALQFDMGDEASVLALRDQILSRVSRIDILINNSMVKPVSGWDDDAAHFTQSMQINATGLFSVTRAFGDLMAAQGGGSIVNIGSIHGLIGPDRTLYEGLGMNGYIPDYFFHKGGMVNFTRFTASYYGPRNVRCNCLSPGGLKDASHSEAFIARYSDRTFLGRMARADDMNGAVVFLASDASSYVTGVNIPVDGGYTAR